MNFPAWTRALAAALVMALGAAAAAAQVTDKPTAVRKPARDLVHEVFELATGPTALDRIRVHHVFVDDGARRPGRDRDRAVFLVHGDGWAFEPAFMGDEARAGGLPGHLARAGIDVWGIDLAWTLVPADATDLTPMRDWGLQHDVDDVLRGIEFAREQRSRRGDGRDALALLGWSRGGQIAYALVHQEARRARHNRSVDRLVIADSYYKTTDAAARDAACRTATDLSLLLQQGVYGLPAGAVYAAIGALASSDPSATSPVLGEPFTNRDAALWLGASTYRLTAAPTPWYHFVAGDFGGQGAAAAPLGLRFMPVERWYRFLQGVGTYAPVRLMAETAEVVCDRRKGAFDDQLRRVDLPVLYVGAAGGFGSQGLHTLSRLGSKDVSSQIVRKAPPGSEALDFGHVDLWHADDADRWVWKGIQAWLQRRGGGR